MGNIEEIRNMILAIVLSAIIIFGFQYYNEAQQPPQGPETAEQAARTDTADLPRAMPEDTPAPSVPGEDSLVPTAPGVLGTSASARRTELIEATARVPIRTSRLNGSVSLAGGRIDDLRLADYRETLAPDSPEIILLNPFGTPDAYFAQFGWTPAADVKTPVPVPDTVWTARGAALTPETPLTLSWDNGKGLHFSRTIEIDSDFMFTITQRVVNSGNQPVTLYPYGFIRRHGTPDITGFYILHEGLYGVFDGTLKEVDYDELQDEGPIKQSSAGGWIGITDKYWLTALVPDQKARSDSRFTHRADDAGDRYQVDYLGAKTLIAAGGEGVSKTRFFAGAKEVDLLDTYMETLGVERFDLAIDWGWLYFLTKPIFHGLVWINGYVGNFGVAILLLTVAIKTAFFPLANKSYTAMSKMKKLQPEMLKLREQFGEDKARLNQEMMALYKREKTNPASGCLPIVIQIPVFFALYKVLFVTIEMRQAPFFGWIQDLSAPDPTSVFNLFGLIPITLPDFLMIGAWPLFMGITMFLQQKLNPQPPDPIQAKIFLFLPIMFTFLLARFPAGLVIYWAWNNLLSILQQWVIMRRMGVR